ncbi:MAG TPA: SUMF1/EgtB/PvdO family nonheme iron enzyme [Phototrophicaceae bacterium]|nr:SUMF1/EgtB/PvdO family nonheme iron enzyme [Phototrophicaceae bacterium]
MFSQNRRLFLLLSVVGLFGLFPMDSVSPIRSQFPSITDDKNIEMILIPSGTFRSGTTLKNALAYCKLLYKEIDADICDLPAFSEMYLVDESNTISQINEFYMDKHEVSVASYLDCVKASVCNLEPVEQEYYLILDDLEIPVDLPVSGITYYDAAVYCAWREARLPTETEWEYAAAGTQKSPFSWGDKTMDIPANFCDKNCFKATDIQADDGYAELAPITAYEDGQSWAGVYNLSGNVAEWTSTRLTSGEGAGSDIRIVKGGSYFSGIYELVVWMRIPTRAGIARSNGFRCAKTVTPIQQP